MKRASASFNQPLLTHQAAGETGSLFYRYRRSLSRNSLAVLFNGGSTFLVNLAVANLLGRKSFGQFAVVQSTALTGVAVASLAVGLTATKYVAEFRDADRERVGRILGLCFLVALTAAALATAVLIAASGWLAANVLRAPELSLALMVVSGSLFFGVVNGYLTGALAGLEAYGAIARAAIAAGTSYCLLCVLGGWAWGRDGALLGVAASAAIQFVVLKRALRQECRSRGLVVRYGDARMERSVLLGFSLPAALSGLSSMPALWAASLFVARQPDGFQQVALYTAATNLRVLTLLGPQLLAGVSVPILNNLRGSGHREAYRKAFRATLASTAGMALAVAAALALLGPSLLRLFGRDFRAGYPVLLVLLLAGVLEAIMVALYQVVQAEARMWASMFLIVLPRDLLIVALSLHWAACCGALGLSRAYAIGQGLALLMTALLVARIGRGRDAAGAPSVVGGA